MGHLTYLHRDPNLIRLLWVFVVDHCVDTYHLLGVYTEWAVLTSALQSVAGARDRTFPPRRVTLTGRWTHHCDLPAPTPTTSMKHTPLSLRLSPEPSTPVFDLPSPFKMHLEYFHPHSIPPTATPFGSQLAHAWCAWEVKKGDENSDAGWSAMWIIIGIIIQHGSTHTTLFTTRFRRAQPSISPMMNPLASDDTLNSLVVCVFQIMDR